MADPFEQIKERAREGWAQGDYPRLAERLEPAARGLVDACAVSAGQEVLDVAAGNGNFALLAAREGASVVASDLTPRMLELGRMRAEAEGLEIEWVEADAEELPFEDARFDCAASVFGAIFAPRPERVAAELFRVVAPGGAIGLTSWIPAGFQDAFFGVLSRYSPPLPDGVPPSIEWGRAEVVRERFAGLAASVRIERRVLPWEFESLESLAEFFRSTSPRTTQMAEELTPERRQALTDELFATVERFNQADDGSVKIEADYAIVVARKRG